jgi:isopenicillin-N N-acyltransferase-like protein
MSFPFVEVSGSPYERGAAHGRFARNQIASGLELYRDLFSYYGHLSWNAALATARRYGPIIESANPHAYGEIVGIADGSGRALEEILALNCRSELLWQEDERINPAAMQCTSFGLAVGEGDERRVFVGQNWDWLTEARENTILLGILQEPYPAILLLTEAGMIGRLGINAAGLALATNTLISSRPGLGVPYNVLLRGILNGHSVEEAVALVSGSNRAVAANYLVGDASGAVVDLETSPEAHGLIEPHTGVVTHANNFRIRGLADSDRGGQLLPDSERRYCRLEALLTRCLPAPTVDDMQHALSDHEGLPSAICRHQDAARPWQEQIITAASIVMDLQENRVWVASGQPCSTPYEEIEWAPLRRSTRRVEV